MKGKYRKTTSKSKCRFPLIPFIYFLTLAIGFFMFCYNESASDWWIANIENDFNLFSYIQHALPVTLPIVLAIMVYIQSERLSRLDNNTAKRDGKNIERDIKNNTHNHLYINNIAFNFDDYIDKGIIKADIIGEAFREAFIDKIKIEFIAIMFDNTRLSIDQNHKIVMANLLTKTRSAKNNIAGWGFKADITCVKADKQIQVDNIKNMKLVARFTCTNVLGVSSIYHSTITGTLGKYELEFNICKEIISEYRISFSDVC